ncbi:MAG: SIMPL domain-containing protein [Dehalococcoidales bacterium]
MKKIWLVVISLVLLIGVVGLVGCSSQSTTSVSTYPQQGISVSGQGKVYAIPDIAILSLGIQAQEETVAAAQAEANAAMEKVMAALKAAGVDEKDIQTQYYSIQQVTQYIDKTQQNKIVGYQVTNTVTAKVRKVDDTGKVIDAVVAAGGDLTRINSISFTVDDPTPYYNQAREQAATYAKAKAAQLADLSGVKLGKVISVSENTYLQSSNVYYDRSVAVPTASGSGTSVSAGQLEIDATIQINYAIDN